MNQIKDYLYSIVYSNEIKPVKNNNKNNYIIKHSPPFDTKKTLNKLIDTYSIKKLFSLIEILNNNIPYCIFNSLVEAVITRNDINTLHIILNYKFSDEIETNKLSIIEYHILYFGHIEMYLFVYTKSLNIDLLSKHYSIIKENTERSKFTLNYLTDTNKSDKNYFTFIHNRNLKLLEYISKHIEEIYIK